MWLGFCVCEGVRVNGPMIVELADGRRWVCVVGSPVHVQLVLCSLVVLYFISLMLWGALVGVLVDDPIDHA